MIPGRIYEHPIESLLAAMLLLGLLLASADNGGPQPVPPERLVAAAKG